MTKRQRDIKSRQRFGDHYTFQGRRLKIGENKQDLIEERHRTQEDLKDKFPELFLSD